MTPATSRCYHTAEAVAGHPPDLSDEQLQALVTEIKDYQITHGSLIKIVRHEEANTVPSIPIGVSLFPTPFPRACFNEAVALQKIFNKLYAKVAQDGEFLQQALKGAIEHDEFVRMLWGLRVAARDVGYTDQPTLGIFRSDYMLHGSSYANAAIKQVEMNTYSVAGGTHSNILNGMHRAFRERGLYDEMCEAGAACSAAPGNNTVEGIVRSLVQACALYDKKRISKTRRLCVVMTVQANNVNICDERPLEYGLWSRNVPCFRVVFGTDVLKSTQLTEYGALLFHPRGAADANAFLDQDKTYEVAVVYHRAGYDPDEYLQAATGKGARLRLECSRAIKCPSISGHLATLKHVQRALAGPRALERFLAEDEAAAIRRTFMPMHSIVDGADGQQLAERIANGEQDAQQYVLKPSLEGGGHNIFRHDIVTHLNQVPREEWSKYVLMAMIEPPSVDACLISPLDLFDGEAVSELGIFGACIWRDSDGSHGEELTSNDQIGWSLKTKSKDIDEMSVVKGFGCFDSPLLVDLKTQPRETDKAADVRIEQGRTRDGD